jgi:hypothetical protein
MAEGVANAGVVTFVKELLKTSTLPAPASLAAYSSFEAWLMANPV